MDSSIDESDLGSLSRRRTSLEVEREGNRKKVPLPPSVCLLLAALLSRYYLGVEEVSLLLILSSVGGCA